MKTRLIFSFMFVAIFYSIQLLAADFVVTSSTDNCTKQTGTLSKAIQDVTEAGTGNIYFDSSLTSVTINCSSGYIMPSLGQLVRKVVDNVTIDGLYGGRSSRITINGGGQNCIKIYGDAYNSPYYQSTNVIVKNIIFDNCEEAIELNHVESILIDNVKIDGSNVAGININAFCGIYCAGQNYIETSRYRSKK